MQAERFQDSPSGLRANGLVRQLVSAGVLRQYDEAVYDRQFTAPDVLAVLLRPAS